MEPQAATGSEAAEEARAPEARGSAVVVEEERAPLKVAAEMAA